ncbi:MAG: isoprenoid biosynthesis glyoxalase ElbB, partial [Niameybacter sp.]
GVLLSGCGIGDGSQIEEVILTYLALDKYKVDYICIAPNKKQFHTVNHLDEQIEPKEERNVLIESARIGRGKIRALDHIHVEELDGLIIPGGIGLFKNLSNYVMDKEQFVLDEQVDTLIKCMHQSQKPIGAMCGGIVLLARCLGSTEGPLNLCTSHGAYKQLLEMNHIIVEELEADEILVDTYHKIVTTPAFLGTQDLYKMMGGVDKLVKALLTL